MYVSMIRAFVFDGFVSENVKVVFLRGFTFFFRGRGPEDFWGATKFFSKILGGHEIFFRNFGGATKLFFRFFGGHEVFFCPYLKKAHTRFHVLKFISVYYLLLIFPFSSGFFPIFAITQTVSVSR